MASDQTVPIEMLVSGFRWTQLIFVATKLGLPDILAKQPAVAHELAKTLKVDSNALERLMRALASLGVLTFGQDHRYRLAPEGHRLCKQDAQTLRPLILTYGEEFWWAPFASLEHSVRTGETAFNHRYGMSFFEYLHRHPKAETIFQANMSAMTGESVESFLELIDFSNVALLVDIGGGKGTLAEAALAKNAAMHAIVFDQPSVIAERKVNSTPSRCEFVAGDFFRSVPAGGDLYTLKDILHDWPDQEASSILKNIRTAMRPDSRLYILERVMPSGVPPLDHASVDITMLVMTGGMERTYEEYSVLLKSAGFTDVAAIGSKENVSIVEARCGEI